VTLSGLVGLGSTAVSLAIPLLLGSLGEIVVEKSGVINVGIEGMMLGGAFAGFAVAQITQNALLGAVAAVGAGVLLALIFALLSIVFSANQVVVGTAINILALGLTGVLYAALTRDTALSSQVPSFGPIVIPVLSKIPIVGRLLFSQDSITYFALLMLPCVSLFLDKTVLGLRLRACGEYPAAADAAGVNVNRIRMLAIAFGGAMAGLAGAHMSIAYTVSFAQGMTNGAGFIALAVVIVGRWKSVGALLAAILFGAANALQFDLQAVGSHMPYQLFLALPYLMTLGALTLNVRKFLAAPTMLGAAYSRS
jgi:general nucleoside transport system permease protein